MHYTGYRQSIFDIRIINRVTAGQCASCLNYFLRSAAHDFTQNIQIHLFRKADNIQGCLYFTTHGIDITQGIGCRNFTKCIWILHHRWKKIQCLYDSNIITDLIHCCVILAVITDQQVGILFSFRQTFQHTT